MEFFGSGMGVTWLVLILFWVVVVLVLVLCLLIAVVVVGGVRCGSFLEVASSWNWDSALKSLTLLCDLARTCSSECRAFEETSVHRCWTLTNPGVFGHWHPFLSALRGPSGQKNNKLKMSDHPWKFLQYLYINTHIHVLYWLNQY